MSVVIWLPYFDLISIIRSSPAYGSTHNPATCQSRSGPTYWRWSCSSISDLASPYLYDRAAQVHCTHHSAQHVTYGEAGHLYSGLSGGNQSCDQYAGQRGHRQGTLHAKLRQWPAAVSLCGDTSSQDTQGLQCCDRGRETWIFYCKLYICIVLSVAKTIVLITVMHFLSNIDSKQC